MANEGESPTESASAGFHRPFEINALTEDGQDERLVATEQEREALAGWLGLAKLERLEAELALKPWRRNGLRVSGRLKADVVQICVVTLEPLERTYEQTFERAFIEGPVLAEPVGTEALIDIDQDDPPDPIENGEIDLGAVVAEELALVIDPYPRKEGAAVDSRFETKSEDKADENPFASLAILKRAANPNGTEK